MSETYLSSLRNALLATMKKDPKVILIGEDIKDPYGGAFKVTKGLSTVFPTRVLSTPISESAIIGISTGLAIRGLKPVAEIMFGDFLALTADQILNNASKFSLMYPNDVKVPLVVRTPMGGGKGYGPTHSQCLEKMFLGIPGLQVICPSIFHLPGDLLTQCIEREDSPVLFIEYKNLYGLSLKLPESLTISYVGTDFPIAIVENSQQKPDVILITYGGLSEQVVQLMDEFVAEEINLRAIIPSDLSNRLGQEIIDKYTSDCDTILIADNNTPGFGWVSETAVHLYENTKNKSVNIQRLTSLNSVVPAAKALEEQVLVTKERLQNKLLEIIV